MFQAFEELKIMNWDNSKEKRKINNFFTDKLCYPIDSNRRENMEIWNIYKDQAQSMGHMEYIT